MLLAMIFLTVSFQFWRKWWVLRKPDKMTLALRFIVDSRQTESILLSHHATCQNVMCCCRQLLQKHQNLLEITEQDYYELLKDIIEPEDSDQLIILLCFIYLEKLENKYRAIYYLNKLSTNHILKVMQFQTIKQIIQTKINNENNIANFGNIRKFHEMYTSFRDLMNDCSQMHLEFWAAAMDRQQY